MVHRLFGVVACRSRDHKQAKEMLTSVSLLLTFDNSNFMISGIYLFGDLYMPNKDSLP